eukprot:6833642-Prymnesium_polylepis.1
MRPIVPDGQFKVRFAQALSQAGLLACDPRGPWEGCMKVVREVVALRCLPGCPPQPAHADVDLERLSYRRGTGARDL